MDRIIELYNHFSRDSLYRNSIYLMLSTAIMAFLGFFFWILCAHLFSPEQVGIATTLISVMTLISTFSILGLGNSLIKYLPTSNRKNEIINTSLTLVGLVSFFLSVVYLIFLNIFSPKLLFIKGNIIFSLLFVLFIVISALNIVIESTFIAHRSSFYVLVKNAVFSIAKLIFPFMLISLGAYGIFMSFGIALVIAFIASFYIIIGTFKYFFKPVIDRGVIRKIAKFSFGNYIAGFFVVLPGMVLPILITNFMGAKFSAYFYMDMMIANLLYIIPIATSQSLFAEGSYGEAELHIHVKKAIKIISWILIPGILATSIFGKYILLAFGKEYSGEGITLLQIFAISGIFMSVNYVGNTLFYIKHNVKLIFLINCIGAAVIIGVSYLLLPRGLSGVGLAWFLGQGVMSIAYLSCKRLIGIVKNYIYRLHKDGIAFLSIQQIWSIGIFTGTSPFSLASPEYVHNPVLTAKDVTDVSAEFVADPFMIENNSVWYMFFEVMNTRSGRGEIGLAISTDAYVWKYKQIVLKEQFHLSYPYIFTWKKEFYMIPESYEANSIRLYKAVDFPTKWSFVKTLLIGKDFVDSSIFQFRDKWWILTSSTKSNILRLYYSDSLMGTWIEHPESPIVRNNSHIARPGGRIVKFGERVIRYTQDCKPTYGNQVRAFEVTELTTKKYKEKEIDGNPILNAGGKDWNALGMHHVDPHQIGINQWIACVDGNY
jgi:O-antigen/teichoic acid export membrane protein